MDPIDEELPELYATLRESLRRKADRSRRKRMSSAACELDFKPGTRLGVLASRLAELAPNDVEKFELIVGTQMLSYCLSTRAGNALGSVAAAEGHDPFEAIVSLIAKAHAYQKQYEAVRGAKKKSAKGNRP